MDGRKNRWMDKLMDGFIDGRKGSGWKDVWVEGRIDGRKD